MAREVELTFVVVFDDDKVVALGAREQLLPPRQWHGDRGRALVARRHVHHLAARQARAEHEALCIDSQRPHMLGAQREVVARIGVARVLDAHRRCAIDQQRGQQEGGLLCTAGDQDLVAFGPDAARGQQAAVDLLDQGLVVAVDVVRGPAPQRATLQRFEHALAPVGGGEQRGVELAVDERVGLLLPVTGLLDVALLRGPQLQALRPADADNAAASTLARAEVGSGELIADEVAAARAADDQALVGERLQRQRHGGARQSEQFGQVAARRQGLAGRQKALHHGVHQHVAQLPLARACTAIETAEQARPHQLAGAGASRHGASSIRMNLANLD
jgi:hypothetical protein